MKITMKRNVSRIVSLSMALVLMGASNPLYASAQEYEAEGDSAMGGVEISLADICEVNENFTIGDMGISFPESDSTRVDLKTVVEGFKAEMKGDAILLYAADEIQPADVEDEVQAYAASEESTLSYGTVSGYLPETGAYALYNLNLSAGDYLQARLTVPNNVNINYALVFFDSELNALKLSDYASCLNGGLALEESVGYLCASDEMIYIGVLSIVGGSETEAFTLDFSVTTNFLENGEPNENVQEAAALSLGNAGATVSGTLNSPVDNDWYSFNVIESPKYYRIRLGLTSSSSTNGCKMEIYRNVGTGNLSMQIVGSGNGEGELSLPVGTYYVRVISEHSLNEFNPADIPVYSLSIVPVSKVSGIQINKRYGNEISQDKVFYYSTDKPGYRVTDKPFDNYFGVEGIVTYKNNPGDTPIIATNIKLVGAVENLATHEVTYGTTVSNQEGKFSMIIRFGEVVNGGYCYVGSEQHIYNTMRVTIWPEFNTEIEASEIFYVLKEIVY